MLSTRKTLIKKLWKSSVAGQNEGESGSDALCESLKIILKSMDSKELKACTQAKDGDAGACWMLASDEVQVLGTTVRPEVVCCKIFRWSDLPLVAESVMRLPVCPESGSAAHSASSRVCCNPFHFGRVVSFDVRPVPQVDVALKARTQPHRRYEGSVSADSAFSEATCSTSSSPMMCRESKSRKHGPQQSESGVYGESTTGSYTSYTTASCTDSSITQDSEGPRTPRNDSESWLMLAYWEGNDRVGRRKSFIDPSVQVHYDGSCAMRQSLNIAAIKNKRRSDAAEKKRQQIGNGLVMWRTSDFRVYFYNASQQAMYVQSPTLSCPGLDADEECVKAIPAGCVVELFNWQRAIALENFLRHSQLLRFPFDATAVRISMVSGWGAGQRRSSIMQCPCWLTAFFGTRD